MSAPEGSSAESGASKDGVGSRWPELIVALLLAVIAALVITDSLRVGTGWGEDGPKSGYFPFSIGLALLGSAVWIAASQLRHWQRNPLFAAKAQLGLVWAILWPMTLYIVLIIVLGIYLPSMLLIGFFMLRHGKHHWGLTLAVAPGVPLLFFLVFEKWFLVLLPKGPVEALLGF